MGIIVQDLYDLVVAILSGPASEKIIGTGLIVSRDGLIATCKHVVCDARKLKEPSDVQQEMRVFIRRGPVINLTSWGEWAKVVSLFSEYDDDIVLLKIDALQPLLESAQTIPVLGNAKQSLDHKFWSYGYGKRSGYQTQHIKGTILGNVPLSKLRVEQVQLQPDVRILNGHSGSPVLDRERNLIVGLVTRGAADAGMATNCEVLGFSPFGLALQHDPLPKQEARRPPPDYADFVRVFVDDHLHWEQYGVPKPVPDAEWVGREDILGRLQDDWDGKQKRLIMLNGFGGEGKSSIARRLLDRLQISTIFWWSFYSNSKVDEFFEAAFAFLTGGISRPFSKLQSISRIDVLGTLLSYHATRFLFVLDGLEIVQHDEANEVGSLQSKELQALLEFFAAPYHESICLITSRIPLCFGHYDTFIQYDLDQLNISEGHALLRNLGVDDDNDKLDIVVQDWEGHALTLTLIGTYLATRHNGKVVNLAIHVEDLPTLAADERRAEQVSRVLGRYDDVLFSEKERSFLLIFSAFRSPVPTNAFSSIFRSQDAITLDISFTDMDDVLFDNLVERLKTLRIIRYDSDEDYYTIHPLMRDHYVKRLNEEHTDSVGILHNLIKDYYLSIIPRSFSAFTLKDLAPLVEAIYHACCAGTYDEAFDLYTKPLTATVPNAQTKLELIERSFSEILITWLGAYRTARELLLGFFAQKDVSGDPQMSQPGNKPTILRDAGRCHMYLSLLDGAVSLYQRAFEGYREQANWGQASNVYRELATLYIYSGRLTESAAAADAALSLVVRPDDPQALELGEFLENPIDAVAAWSLIGFIDTLQGELDQAALSFAQARVLYWREKQRKDLPIKSGLLFVMYLLRAGEIKNATQLTKTYLKRCHQSDLTAERNQCHRILGDIFAATGKQQHADRHYTLAVKFAREFARRDLLIEALSARGRWAARQGNADLARADLEEALVYARDTYWLYEVDIRVGLATLHQVSNNYEAAKQEAQAAERMSKHVGYDWGLRGVADVLRAMGA